MKSYLGRGYFACCCNLASEEPAKVVGCQNNGLVSEWRDRPHKDTLQYTLQCSIECAVPVCLRQCRLSACSPLVQIFPERLTLLWREICHQCVNCGGFTWGYIKSTVVRLVRREVGYSCRMKLSEEEEHSFVSYPAMLAMELSASKPCAIVTLGTWSMASTLLCLSESFCISSGFWAG